MTQIYRRAATAALAPAIASCVLWLAPSAGAAASPSAGAAASPSAGAAASPSAYRVGTLCGAPAPGYVSCLGLRLVPKRPLSVRGARALATPGGAGSADAASSHASSARGSATPALKRVEFKEPWLGSLGPQNVLEAYSLTGLPAPLSRQTLALVDAYNDPTAEHDLKVFDEHYGLPACSKENGCFEKIEMRGGSPESGPPTEAGWAQEIATDVEVAHGVCQECKILLVEAHSASGEDLEAAEEEAERRGATEISNSWGGTEAAGLSEAQINLARAADAGSPFDHPGTVITASSGDDGYLGWMAEAAGAEYPASSPHVIAVGGTRLSVGAGGAWAGETVWNGRGAGGGGCSTALQAPPWQQALAGWSAVGCGESRAVADVSADADPYTGVAVYDSTPIVQGGTEYLGWWQIGGTSVASPIIAATFALAGGAGMSAGGETVSYPAQTLYENLANTPGSLHDVASGSNGECAQPFDEETGESGCLPAEEAASCAPKLICRATTGYDGPSGVGTPDGIAAFLPAGTRPAGGSKGGTVPSGEEPPAPGGNATEAPPTGSEQRSVPTSTGAAPPSGSIASAPRLSALSLTHSAILALNRVRPKASQLGFAFTISETARVHVKLAKWIGARGHGRWRLLPDSLTITATTGRNSRRLNARGTLTPGLYQLTLAPVNGTVRALTFHLG